MLKRLRAACRAAAPTALTIACVSAIFAVNLNTHLQAIDPQAVITEAQQHEDADKREYLKNLQLNASNHRNGGIYHHNLHKY